MSETRAEFKSDGISKLKLKQIYQELKNDASSQQMFGMFHATPAALSGHKAKKKDDLEIANQIYFLIMNLRVDSELVDQISEIQLLIITLSDKVEDNFLLKVFLNTANQYIDELLQYKDAVLEINSLINNIATFLEKKRKSESPDGKLTLELEHLRSDVIFGIIDIGKRLESSDSIIEREYILDKMNSLNQYIQANKPVLSLFETEMAIFFRQFSKVKDQIAFEKSMSTHEKRIAELGLVKVKLLTQSDKKEIVRDNNLISVELNNLIVATKNKAKTLQNGINFLISIPEAKKDEKIEAGIEDKNKELRTIQFNIKMLEKISESLVACTKLLNKICNDDYLALSAYINKIEKLHNDITPLIRNQMFAKLLKSLYVDLVKKDLDEPIRVEYGKFITTPMGLYANTVRSADERAPQDKRLALKQQFDTIMADEKLPQIDRRRLSQFKQSIKDASKFEVLVMLLSDEAFKKMLQKEKPVVELSESKLPVDRVHKPKEITVKSAEKTPSHDRPAVDIFAKKRM